MQSVIFILLSSVCLFFHLGNAADCTSCVNCINNNAPKKDNQYMIFADHSNSCDVRKDYSTFKISSQSPFNGCGYADDINALYNRCTNECNTCKKVDSQCATVTDRPSSTITCQPLPCAKRGERRGFGRVCCDNLQILDGSCIDPNQDCTPCGHKIEANKPCCDASGINSNGIWRCINPLAGCKSCKFDSGCGDKRCINGCCT